MVQRLEEVGRAASAAEQTLGTQSTALAGLQTDVRQVRYIAWMNAGMQMEP
jgi:hypothetical protein